jgi:hypothetical protein
MREPLYILSFDQRGSFKQALMGIDGDPSPHQRARISELKELVYDGFQPSRAGCARRRPSRATPASPSAGRSGRTRSPSTSPAGSAATRRASRSRSATAR